MPTAPPVPLAMKLQYLKRRKADAETLKTALTENDFQVFSRVGHQLAGNAVTFGHEELEPIARRLEEAGLAQARDAAETALAKYQEWLALQE